MEILKIVRVELEKITDYKEVSFLHDKGDIINWRYKVIFSSGEERYIEFIHIFGVSRKAQVIEYDQYFKGEEINFKCMTSEARVALAKSFVSSKEEFIEANLLGEEYQNRYFVSETIFDSIGPFEKINNYWVRDVFGDKYHFEIYGENYPETEFSFQKESKLRLNRKKAKEKIAKFRQEENEQIIYIAKKYNIPIRLIKDNLYISSCNAEMVFKFIAKFVEEVSVKFKGLEIYNKDPFTYTLAFHSLLESILNSKSPVVEYILNENLSKELKEGRVKKYYNIIF